MIKLKVKPIVTACLIVIALAGILWLWRYVHNPNTLPIRSVKIKASYKNFTQAGLQKMISPYVEGGFFSVDIAGIKNALLKLPWTANVTIKRAWPDTIIVRVIEQFPVAHWGEKGLLNQEGELFYPDVKAELSELPVLVGPQGSHQQVLKDYVEMDKQVRAMGFYVKTLTLNNANAYELSLNNGVKILLGSETPYERLARFISVYEKIIGSRGDAAEQIDLRYPHGLTVRWKK